MRKRRKQEFLEEADGVEGEKGGMREEKGNKRNRKRGGWRLERIREREEWKKDSWLCVRQRE